MVVLLLLGFTFVTSPIDSFPYIIPLILFQIKGIAKEFCEEQDLYALLVIITILFVSTFPNLSKC